jgi:D-ribulokinase
VRQIMADTTGLTVALPTTPEPVLLGSAMLGAAASKTYPSIAQAMGTMSKIGGLTQPTDPRVAAFHANKRKVYALLRGLDGESRAIMGEASVASRAGEGLVATGQR